MEISLFAQISSLTRRRFGYAILAIFCAIAFGSIGFFLIEGISLLDSVYLATETVTTVGYGDVTPKTASGRVFAIFFMLIGGGTVLYSLTSLVQSIIQSEVISIFDNRRKIKEMEKLSNHFIICGAGRVGRRIIHNLEQQKQPFIIIEKDSAKVTEWTDIGGMVIIGDATSEESLLKAGVSRAKGLATCLATDAANVYVVLTARGMNEKLHIVARAVEEEAEPKLIRAGASRVVAPTIIGSQSMARALLKPAIADFMESIVAENLDLAFEEVAVNEKSNYVGKKLKDTNIRYELDLVIVAIRRKLGEMVFHPSGETMILAGDLLIVIGRAEAVQKLVNESK